MIVLWIFLALLALLLAVALVILFARVRILICGNEEHLIMLKFYVYGIRVFRFSVRDKDKRPKRIRLSDYSPEALEKRRARQEKRAARHADKKEAADALRPRPDVMYILKFIKELLYTFAKYYANQFKVKILKLNVTVATEDAASTAILYGAVSQSVGYLIEFLKNNTDLTVPRGAEISVISDFCGKTANVDVKLEIVIRLRKVISLLYRSGLRSPADLKHFFKQ